MTTGIVEVLQSSAPGFYVSSGRLCHDSLPALSSLVVLREHEAQGGAGYRDSQVAISGVTTPQTLDLAGELLAEGRSPNALQVAGIIEHDGSIDYNVIAEDDLGCAVLQSVNQSVPTTYSAYEALLPRYFAQFNDGVTPEALSISNTAGQSAKIFYIIPVPPRIAPIEPNVSEDWQGNPIFPSMSASDNDRTFADDALDYLIHGKHPTDSSRSAYGPSGTPYANFTKFKGGRRVVIRNWDTMGYPFTYSTGANATEQPDIRIEGVRGDYTSTPDADFLYANGQPNVAYPPPIFGKAYCVSKGQHGNNRDPYLKFNVPGSGKLSASVTSLAKDATTGIVTATLGAAFPDKQNGAGSPYGAGATPSSPKPCADDFLLIDGSAFGGDTTPLTRFNWQLDIVTFQVSSAAGTVTDTGSAASPVFTLGGTYVTGNKVDLYVAGTRFSYTVPAGATLSSIATALKNLIAADSRFSGTTSSGAVITVVSTASPQTVFACKLHLGHNVPSGAQSATGGTAYWFVSRTPSNTSIGTHADGSQYAQATPGEDPIYQAWVMEDHCTYEGNYDGFIAANSTASDCFVQLTRVNYRFNYIAPSDIGSGTFRLGATVVGGFTPKAKYIHEVYASYRPLDTIASGIALSANGGEGVLVTLDGQPAAYTPSRPEVKGLFKAAYPGMADFAPFADSGVDWVHPGYSGIDVTAGAISDITFSGLSSIDENIAGGASIGLLDVVTTNKGGDVDLQVVASNVPTSQWFLHGRRLVRGTTPFDYETTPSHVATVTIRASIRGSLPAVTFDKVFSFPVNDKAEVSATWQSQAFNAGPANPQVYPSPGTAAIGSPASDRYVVCLATMWASVSGRVLNSTQSLTNATDGTLTMTRLVQQNGGQANNNYACAALYIANVVHDSVATVSIGTTATATAGGVGLFAVTGIVSTTPYATGSASVDTVAAQTTMTINMPANGFAVLGCAYTTASGNNKRQSGALFTIATAGTYYIRVTVQSGAAGPLTWEYSSDNVNWTTMPNETSGPNVNAPTTGMKFDWAVESLGGAGTVLVGASF